MVFRLWRRGRSSGRSKRHFTIVRMPLRLTEGDAGRAFVRPLAHQLAELGLGRVTGHRVEHDAAGEPQRHEITLSLVTDAPRVFTTIAGFLDGLDAPQGSWIGTADCPEMLMFGHTRGLALYLDPRDAAHEDDVLDVLEACTDALEGSGIYQGSGTAAGRRALYFYGDNFNRMQKAMTFVLTTDPRCRNAFAKRLD